MPKERKINPKNIVLITILTGIILSLWVYFMIPRPLFAPVYSTLLESNDGRLMGARIASDGQWRFPEPDSIPVKFQTCLINFEDRHFHHHHGVNPASIARAFYQNVKKGRVVSGGSTITMQLARLARPSEKRNIANKLMEMAWARNIENRYSKKKILTLYAAHAPFGGNVVGLEAASWRYYQCPPHLLSWGESATLAVLPNAPALIFPGKNDKLLIQKRNRLLDK
ncbi:MAG: transglycosylase domain-containing protein, partial [Prolixibacteraceae bacterium]|nr:transglycosylase domain-containing protein [Prolixibacteraceae bacterium]